MVVCDYISVGGIDEARAGRCRLSGVAPVVCCDLGGYADGGVNVCGVHLGSSHLLARVDARCVYDRCRALALVNGRAAIRSAENGVSYCRAAEACEHRRNEHARDHSAGLFPERLFLRLGRPGLCLHRFVLSRALLFLGLMAVEEAVFSVNGSVLLLLSVFVFVFHVIHDIASLYIYRQSVEARRFLLVCRFGEDLFTRWAVTCVCIPCISWNCVENKPRT